MTNTRPRSLSGAALFLSGALLLLSSCVGQQTTRMGMVKDPKTGLMFGSVVGRNIVTDASFYNNNKIKVRTRNTSGDRAFGLREFTDELRKTYANNGYQPTAENDFGLLVDVNVMYSGQIQRNMSSQYALLGAAGGGIAGYRSQANAGTVIGTVAGATLGSILGSFVTDDTYIIVADVTFGIIKKYNKSSKTVTFSRSPKLSNIDDTDDNEKIIARGFKKTYHTQVAVYAGGRNVSQAEIANEVRRRIIRIVGDFI